MALDVVRLGKLLALAGSANDGEALAALRKLRKHLDDEGVSFTDLGQKLIGPSPRPANRAKAADSESFVDESGTRWPSREAFEKFQAGAAMRREANWRRTAAEREEIIALYGSPEKALARNPSEQAVHEAVADFLTPFAPDLDPPGRWHKDLAGWDRGSFGPPPPDIVARIEQALPLPTNLREAKQEVDAWAARAHELEMLLGRPDDSPLDLPAFFRAQRVQALFERELPIQSIDDLHLRLRFTANPEWSDETGMALPEILEAFESLIITPAAAPEA